MSDQEKAICVERREHNSSKPHYNHIGDWRPRLIIWPEYGGLYKDELDDEGLDDETDCAWGLILEDTFRQFCRKHELISHAFERQEPPLWKRLISRTATWRLDDKLQLKVDFFNQTQHAGHEEYVFLFRPSTARERVPTEFWDRVLDRTNLLPYGVAIAGLGIEEAVVEISFSAFEQSFLEILQAVSQEHGHRMLTTAKHWLSHWVIARYRGHQGDEWAKF